jgi:hypothetical protein
MKQDAARFPAAHSMDSEWFAVDAEGRVAVFDTGEPGPMPEEALGGQGIAWELLPRLSELAYDLSGLDPVADGQLVGTGGELLVTRPQGTASGLYWLASAEAWERVQHLKGLHRLTGGGGELLALGDMPGDVLGELQRDCLLNRAWLMHDLDPSRFGFFTYEYREPYERAKAPRRPAALPELPPALGEELARVTLGEVSFARDAAIEPRLFVSCNAYSEEDGGGGPGWLAGKSWVAVDGQGRIALLDTGDCAAAVPYTVGFQRLHRDNVVHWLTEAEPLACDVADLLVDPDGAVHLWGQARPLDRLEAYLGDCLLWLADESALELARGRAPLRRCDVPGHCVAWGALAKTKLEELVALGGIRKAWVRCQLDAARVGLYVFEGEAADRPYGRVVAPAAPALLDALPERTRARLGRWRFPDADFARDASFEPRRFVECIYGEGLHGGPGWGAR